VAQMESTLIGCDLYHIMGPSYSWINGQFLQVPDHRNTIFF
jgi:hypothetical protein